MAKESVEVKKGYETSPEKLKALQATLDKIEKDYGKGTVMKMGEQAKMGSIYHWIGFNCLGPRFGNRRISKRQGNRNIRS